VAPAANISCDHPERRSSVAARISQRIASVLPSAPVMSKYRYECGFTKSMRVIRPVSVTGFDRSNSPNP